MNVGRLTTLRSRMISQREIAKRADPFFRFYEGHRAGTEGRSPCSCPYVLESSEWCHWFGGWKFAVHGEGL